MRGGHAGLLNGGLESTRLGVTSAALIGYPMETNGWLTAEARGQPGHLYSLTRYDDLAGYAYDTLRRHLLERVELFACEHCGRINVRTRGLQCYCPTLCDSRAKEERHKARRRGQTVTVRT